MQTRQTSRFLLPSTGQELGHFLLDANPSTLLRGLRVAATTFRARREQLRITLTLQNSNSYQVVFWEYSFTTSSSSLDTSGTALTRGNGTTISGVGLNLTGSNDVIIQWTGCVPTGVASPYGHLIGNSEVKFADNENSTNVAATNMWFTTWTATSCLQAAAAFK